MVLTFRTLLDSHELVSYGRRILWGNNMIADLSKILLFNLLSRLHCSVITVGFCILKVGFNRMVRKRTYDISDILVPWHLGVTAIMIILSEKKAHDFTSAGHRALLFSAGLFVGVANNKSEGERIRFTNQCSQIFGISFAYLPSNRNEKLSLTISVNLLSNNITSFVKIVFQFRHTVY